MTEGDDDDLFDNEGEDDVEVESAGRPRRSLVILGVVMAAFVFIGVAGTVLILYFVVRVRDHTDPNHTIRAKYSNRYTTCVQKGGSESQCSDSVYAACEHDGWWKQAARAPQRDTECRKTVP